MDVNKVINESLAQLPSNVNQLYVAFSGGLDSSVLLHALHNTLSAKLRAPTLTLQAFHVHHGLSSLANNWVEHCRQFAERLLLPLDVVYVNANPQQGESPEAAARQARYDAFKQQINPNRAFVLAHHANDQAETLLLQLLRGSGLRGLASMPVLASFNDGWLLRPFLSITRKELECYAEQHQLTWVDDESNLNIDFDRNYLRHQVMPLLESRWPAAVTCLSRSARHCAEAEELLSDVAASDLAKATTDNTLVLNIQTLITLPLARLNNVLRYWLKRCHLPIPSTVKLQTIIKTVIHSRYDAMPCVTWPGAEVRRYRHQLYAMPPLMPHDPSWRCEWDVTEDLDLPANMGTLHVENYKKLADGQVLTIGFRQGKEKIRLEKQTNHHLLKNLMQEWGIPPWQRQRIPLIFKEQELVAVHGFSNQ